MTTEEPLNGGEEEARARPTSFMTVVARSWRWYRGNAGPLLRIFIFVGVLNLVAQAPLFAADDPPFALGFMLGLLFPAVTYGYAYAVAAYLLQHDADDDPLTARTAFREVRPRTRTLVNAAVLGSALTAVNPLGAVLPALFFGPPMLVQVIAIEGRELGDAWTRLKSMMAGHWGRVVLFLVSLSLALGALLQTVFSLVLVAIEDLSENGRSSVLLVVYTVFITFVLPFLAAAQFDIFDDVRADPDRPRDSGSGSAR